MEAPSPSRRVVWLFEGNTERVKFQETSVERILASHTAESCTWLRSREESDALLDYLSALPHPGDGVPSDLGIVRLLTLPGVASRLEEDVLAHFQAQDDLAARVSCDALTGAITVRWRRESGESPDSGGIADPVAALRSIAADHASRGVVLYLPPEVRSRQEYLLRADPQQELVGKLLRVLDPEGILSPGRIHRGERPEVDGEES